MEEWNRRAFLLVDAPVDAPSWLVVVATVLAQDAIFAIPVGLAATWLWGRHGNRGGLLLAFIAGEIALGLNQIAGLVVDHTRPFAVPVGRTLIEHVADNSFPSDHGSFMAAVGICLVLWVRPVFLGGGVLALAAVVAWSRLYLGIHFPLDMAGSLISAAIATVMVVPMRGWVASRLLPRHLDPLYGMVFSRLVRRGWVRP